MQPNRGRHLSNYNNEDSNQYSQQQQLSGNAGGNHPSGPGICPTLDAPVHYYPSQPSQQYTPRQSYYQPNRASIATSQFSLAKAPVEHKPIAVYQEQHLDYGTHATSGTYSEPPMAMERMCDVCQYPDPVLVAPNCNHTFHSRCVHVWPMDSCPACAEPLDEVAISPTVNMMARPEPRSGKWTRPEEKFIDGVLREFDRQALPLAHGTPIRFVLAKMLNCSTMRLSKKFQKNALGKRTFRVTKPGKGEKALQFDPVDHARRQRELSQLEQIFRQELVDQFRRENNTDEGALIETQNLCVAVQQFWVSNMLKFAVLVGQPVVGMDVSDAKKRKRAMQLLRNGQFDELLSWHHHPSPVSRLSITPMPPVLTATSSNRQAVSASWGTSAAMHSSSVVDQTQQESGSSIPVLLHKTERPAKKMRTPEANVRVGHFGLSTDQCAVYPHYGRTCSPEPSVSSFDFSQQQQYHSEPYVRPSSYSPFPEGKTPIGYANVLQYQQQQQQMLPGLAIHDQQRSGLALTAYQRAGEVYHASGTGQTAPWEDLLENMSFAANSAKASAVGQGHSFESVDRSMQSWSGMHMM
ncbi:unnamed protein product [Peronospora belbahrii]|uniref:RING-type domain-containing protein n=1 Tax=Peronospora belbahrii TaxID=622444 RepID=A0AAU9KV65_9STRA|nr:unnamed protein product [Peronospora belbahrii]